MILWSPSPFGRLLSSTTSLVPWQNDSPAGLLEDIQKTVACLISVGHRFGISINTSEGKTEAMVHLVGPTAKDTLSALFTTRPRATCFVSWSFTKVSTLAWFVLASILE